MEIKQYSSFDEIDRDLRILKLQREIDKEQLLLMARQAKNRLYPTNLLGGMGGLAQKFIIALLAKKLAKKF